jgi:hypothetical protein
MSNGFWAEVMAAQQDKLAETRQPLPPQIPQHEPVPAGMEGFWKQAGELLEGPEPAQSVAQRFGQAPGADIGTTARRPGPTAEAAYQDGDRDQERRQMALAVKLATEAGAFDSAEGSQAKAARDRAAIVQGLVHDKVFDTVEDTLRRRVNPQGVAGYTAGQG